MLMRLYFTEFILAFCALHLVVSTWDRISEKIAASRRKKMPAPDKSRMVLRGSKGNDWYVFFPRTALVGQDRPLKPRRPDSRDGAYGSKTARVRADARPRDGRISARPSLRMA